MMQRLFSIPAFDLISVGGSPYPIRPAVLLRGYKGASELSAVLLRGYKGASEPSAVLLRGYKGASEPSAVLLRGYKGASEPSAVLLRGYKDASEPSKDKKYFNQLTKNLKLWQTEFFQQVF